MKQSIKKFGFEGETNEDYLIGTKDRCAQIVEEQMRIAGYVPVLDLDHQFFISYNEKKETFSFSFCMFGVYVGKKKQSKIVGFSGTSFITKD